MKRLSIDQAARLVFQLRIKLQRSKMIEKIARVQGQEFADEVKQKVIDLFKEGRDYADYSNTRKQAFRSSIEPRSGEADQSERGEENRTLESMASR